MDQRVGTALTVALGPGKWQVVGKGVLPLGSPKPPRPKPARRVALDKRGWVATASVPDSTFLFSGAKIPIAVPAAHALDGDAWTGWRDRTRTQYPGQWFQVDLGSTVSVGRIVMDLPPSTSWGARTQTILIQGSTDGTNYSTVVGTANYTFDPSTGNTVTVTFSSASVRYLKLTFTANTAWPAGQLSELQAYAS